MSQVFPYAQDDEGEGMKIAAYMLACEGREAVQAETLRSFAETDWDAPMTVHGNESQAEGKPRRVAEGMLALLERALAGEGDYFLICENDVEFNRWLRWNLTRWAPLRAGAVELGSLYNPGVQGRRWHGAQQALIAPVEQALGAQARLYSRRCAEHVVRRFRHSAWLHDVAIARLAGELGPILYHAPSLVQHRAGPSGWGGPGHTALEFDPGWRVEGGEVTGPSLRSG